MLLFIVVGIMIDQLIKLYVVSTFMLGEWASLMPGVQVTLAMNQGVAFGLFAFRNGVGFYLLNAFIVIFNLVMIEILSTAHANAKSYRYGLALLITGGLSNLVDRVCYGAVVDYLTLNVFGFAWPTIFNLADMLICLGCFMLCLVSANSGQALSSLSTRKLSQP